jgi:hypothetical protein
MGAVLPESACRVRCLILLLAIAGSAQAAQQAAAPVATCGPVPGVLLERAAPGAAWQFVDENNAIPADVLLVALPDATLYSANRHVQLHMIADIGQRGPLPVFESAVRLHHNSQVDMDVTVDRGIVAFSNLQSSGAARVRVRLADQSWNLTLREPGAKVGLEIHGRQPPGIPHFVESGGHVKIQEPPTMEVYLLVVNGHAALEANGQELSLEAPPGAAKLHWDNVFKKIEVSYLDKLPETILPQTAEEKAKYAEVCAMARTLRDGPIDDVLEKALNSEKPLAHRAAVVLLGALDKLPRLLEVLASSKYPEARDRSIVVLRNWVGRGPGQADRLYDYLTAERKLSPAQAKTAIHLLFGFDEQEQRDPDTYEVLIQSLKHSKLAVRELARWHLVRLAPEGKSINYDAAAPEQERERAYEQWRGLIPTGQLPPHLRAQTDKK